MRVQLSDGWADIRDPRKLTERQTGALEDAQFEALAAMPPGLDFEKVQDMNPVDMARTVGAGGARAMRQMKRTLLLTYVSAWSFGDVTEDVLLDEVPSYLVAELTMEVEKVVRATGGPRVNVEPNPDPVSPILPSGD